MFKLFREELARVSWPLLVLLITVLLVFFIGISRANLEVVLFKFLIFCPAIVLVHLSRKKLFPYIDFKSSITETTLQDSEDVDGPTDLGFAIKDAAVILGVFAYYVGMTYILVSAI